MAGELTISSLNCRGLHDPKKRKDVFDFLKRSGTNVFCLQDVHWDHDMLNDISKEWGSNGRCFIVPGTSNSRGVAVLLNTNFNLNISRVHRSPDGNLIAIVIDTPQYSITLVVIYGPNADNPSFFDYVHEVIEEFNTLHYIVVGDWNVAIDPDLDCYNYLHTNNPKSRHAILNLMNDLNLYDAWRVFHPLKKGYTWRQKNPFKQSRLDYFLISSGLLNTTIKTSISYGYRTDHSMVNATFRVGSIATGRGYWKFNNSLLMDVQYHNIVQQVIVDTVTQYACIPYNSNKLMNISKNDIQFNISDQLFFETLLMNIRGKTISYATLKKKSENKREDYLLSEINRVERCSSQSVYGDYLYTLDKELQELREKRLKGNAIRSRVEWMEDGEKPSKFFLNLEKRNYVNKLISHVTNDHGDHIFEGDAIQKEVYNFYQSLYNCNDHLLSDINLENHFAHYNLKKVPASAANRLEGPLSYAEVYNVLKNLKNNKSPGSDGFTVEFYKFFWKDIGYFLTRSLNEGFINKSLSVTQRHGIITLIPKGNKPRNFLNNWRPISLLNVSYKIAASCVANRIKNVISDLISPEQSGFIKGRYIGDSIRIIYDTMFNMDENNSPGILFAIDFQKAFDSISLSFIRKVLNLFNFGPSILQWFDAFYSNASSSVIVNGFTSRSFPLERGCRQGDPLSPYLFILCAELLNQLVCSDNRIRGVGDRGCKLVQYADDTTFFIHPDETSVCSLLQQINFFSSISGLQLNVNKSLLVGLGSMKDTVLHFDCLEGVPWLNSGDDFILLGIIFNTDLDSMISKNYDNALSKMHGIINSWGNRNLTVLGRITVVKSLILPCFNYYILSLPSPAECLLSNINKLLFQFIWNNKPDRISRNQICQSYPEGGLRMVDFSIHCISLKVSIFNKLLRNPDNIPSNISLRNCNVFVNEFYKNGDYFLKIASLRVQNPFWKDVFNSAFFYLNKFINSSFIDKSLICCLPIWNNSLLQIGNRPVNYQHWAQKGVLFINDLLDDGGGFLSLGEFLKRYPIKTNFLEYYGLITAAKLLLLRAIDTGSISLMCKPLNSFTNVILNNGNFECRFVNTLLLHSPRRPCKSYLKWTNSFNISSTKWTMYCMIPFNASKDVYIRWFQYRLMHRIIPTNYYLNKIGIIPSSMCTFCLIHTETIQHLFFYCDFVQRIWNYFDAVFSNANINIDLDFSVVLFGGDFAQVLNLILILIKCYIFNCKKIRVIPSVNGSIKYLINYFQMQKLIFKKNMNESIWERYWLPWLNLF